MPFASSARLSLLLLLLLLCVSRGVTVMTAWRLDSRHEPVSFEEQTDDRPTHRHHHQSLSGSPPVVFFLFFFTGVDMIPLLA
jgi:hypothetical protein